MTQLNLKELFTQSLTMPAGLNWLADQVLAMAARVQRLSLVAGAGRLTLIPEDGVDISLDDYQRLARPLFARIANVIAEETGRTLSPYDGYAVLSRKVDVGLFEFEIEFCNTPGTQVLRARRRPARKGEATDLAGAAGVLDRHEVR